VACGTEEAWTLNPSRVLRTGKPASLVRGLKIGLVAGLDLSLDEGSEELLRSPALSLGSLAELRCDGPDAGELEAAEAGDQIRGESGRDCGHRIASRA
jgi:hypothetical protein